MAGSLLNHHLLIRDCLSGFVCISLWVSFTIIISVDFQEWGPIFPGGINTSRNRAAIGTSVSGEVHSKLQKITQ